MPYIGFEKVRGDLCIYRSVPPTHEYGTRPFLRWARSQGRSPHASGKAKNTFSPVGIPLFGTPQAPGNNLPPNGDISLGDGPLRPEEISSAKAHPAEPLRGKTAYRMQPKNWRGKVTNTLKKSGVLCIYRCVPPTHEYGTRPFLRWARSQGRSPHASGKAKNTFGPVGIPLFGAPQAPGNKPNPPEGGISLGGWPPEAGGNLKCRGTHGRTAQR